MSGVSQSAEIIRKKLKIKKGGRVKAGNRE
jgi:hypothetical protein